MNITLDGKGGKIMSDVTRNAVKRRMAVLFIEHKVRETGDSEGERRIDVEKSIISLATIQTTLGSSFRITGLDSVAESSELALLLRAGALAAPIYTSWKSEQSAQAWVKRILRPGLTPL